MDLHEAIRRRAMVRSFATDPVDPVVLDTVMQAALRAPSAGNTAGTSWVVLEGPAQTSLYWESTTDEAWRPRAPAGRGSAGPR
jgi:nitroreductase